LVLFKEKIDKERKIDKFKKDWYCLKKKIDKERNLDKLKKRRIDKFKEKKDWYCLEGLILFKKIDIVKEKKINII
jgi:hypothetical protein